MNDSIFYTIGKNRLGPVPVAELRGMAMKGEFKRSDRVWREGMAQWQQASSIPEIFLGVPPDLEETPITPPPLPDEEPMDGGQGRTTSPNWKWLRDAMDVRDPVTQSQADWLAFALSAPRGFMGALRLRFMVALPLAALFFFVGFASVASESDAGAFIGFVLGLAFLAFAYVSWMQVHYKMWTLIPRRLASTTPGKAVGFYFIPLFNFYWCFITFRGLAIDANKTLDDLGEKGVRCNEQLALFFSIGMVAQFLLGGVPILGLLILAANYFLWIMFYADLAKAFAVLEKRALKA
jgi:hypothetical protein